MTTSDQIRALADGGMRTAEIAKKLGIRYQFAYNVAKGSNRVNHLVLKPRIAKPPLETTVLAAAGFQLVGVWQIGTDEIIRIDASIPKSEGVYAFCQDGVAKYVGVATMGLAKRLYFYSKPGISQRTSLRLNAALKEQCMSLRETQVWIAQPENLEWNGLPVHGAAGLELGLIKSFDLPWNLRSATK